MNFIRSTFRVLTACAAVLATTVSLFAAEPPKWILEAIAKNSVDAPGSATAPAKVLLDDTACTIGEQGTSIETQRVVLVIRNKSGVEHAQARVAYLEGGDVVKRADAWLIRGGKVVRNHSLREWLDHVADSEDLATDSRRKYVSLQSVAVPGDVFAYETRVEGRMLLANFSKGFGWFEPVQLERYQLQIPAGFTLDHFSEGPGPFEPTVSADGRTFTWTLLDRPYLKSESWSDPAAREHPLLRLRVRPSAAAAAKFTPAIFLGWNDVTRWEEALNAGQCDVSPALQATAAKVTAGLPDWGSRVGALCEYAQKVRYIALTTELARGFGYRPRRASVVHSSGYGDCKDKSNLLRALLREIGVKSHPVIVLSGDEHAPVNPQWPSPDQFNHAILAIETPADFQSPAIITIPDGRRLLIFDPTDDDTPLGGLPSSLQGSLGHFLMDGVAELIRLPALPDEHQYHGRHFARLKLKGDGGVDGEARAEFNGQLAASMRRSFRPLSEKETRERVLGSWSETLRAANLKTIERRDQMPIGRYELKAEFSAPGFAQPLRETLALVRLDLFNRDSVPVFAEKQRRTPVRIEPVTFEDEITLELPEGVSLDELPPAAKVEGRYGSLQRNFTANGNTIVLQRRFQLRRGQVPVAEYAALRQFLSDCAKADRAAVILRR